MIIQLGVITDEMFHQLYLCCVIMKTHLGQWIVMHCINRFGDEVICQIFNQKKNPKHLSVHEIQMYILWQDYFKKKNSPLWSVCLKFFSCRVLMFRGFLTFLNNLCGFKWPLDGTGLLIVDVPRKAKTCSQ